MIYCNDVDLLHWEPNIFRDALFASQLLISGTGNLAGTSFTLASGSLTSAHVVPDEVIVLSGALAGSFPIVSIDSATQLTLSVSCVALSTLTIGKLPANAPLSTMTSSLATCELASDPDASAKVVPARLPVPASSSCDANSASRKIFGSQWSRSTSVQ